MKKIFSLILIVIILLCCVACSSSDIDLDYSSNNESKTSDYESTNESQSDDGIVDESERTFEVVRKFVELYNNKFDPDIQNTKESITDDRILKYDDAYAIQGDIAGEYIYIMNFGSWDVKDEMHVQMYVDTPEEVFKLISDVSSVIGKPLTDADSNNTKQYLNECFTDEYQKYTEWTSVGSVRYWSGYNGIGDNYEVMIEFSIDTFYK